MTSLRPRLTMAAERPLQRPVREAHSASIVSRGMGTAASKMEAFKKAGAKVATFPTDIAGFVAEDL